MTSMEIDGHKPKPDVPGLCLRARISQMVGKVVDPDFQDPAFDGFRDKSGNGVAMFRCPTTGCVRRYVVLVEENGGVLKESPLKLALGNLKTECGSDSTVIEQ